MGKADSFVRSSRLIVVFTVVSRVLGLLRESLFGYFFSAGEALSAFRVAMLIPGLMRRLFAEGALSASLVPALAGAQRDGLAERRSRLLGAVLRRVAFFAVLAILILEVGLGIWRWWGDDLALRLTQVLLPYAGMMCVVGVASAGLHVHRRFAIPAAGPIVLNVCVMAGVLAGRWFGSGSWQGMVWGTCGGVLTAGVLQMAWTGVALRGEKLLGGLWWRGSDGEASKVLWRAVPAAVGVSVVHISALLDMVIAYLFIRAEGERVGPAVLGYAQVVYQLPMGVLAVSLATAMFPEFSAEAGSEGSRLGELLGRGIRLSLFVALPSAAGLMLVAEPLVASCFEHGAFGAEETRRVSGVLILYSVSIPAHFVQLLLGRALYSLGDVRGPARIAAAMVGLDLALNLALVGPLEERGLAASSSICAIVQVVLLGSAVRARLPEVSLQSVVRMGQRSFAFTLLMSGIVLLISAVLEHLGADFPAVVLLSLLVVAGVSVYAGAAAISGAPELRELLE